MPGSEPSPPGAARASFAGEDDIRRIGEGVLARTLPKAEWTHAAHFAAALWIVARRPDLAAERDMPGLIRAYNEATGVANTDHGGYHETITLASLRGLRAHLAAAPAGEPLHRTCNALLASPLGDKRWPAAYWSHALLFSPAARRAWVDPDLAPLPF
ncbi:hypothetical protein C5708_15115 [Caulobacter sp. CCUG 60055]|uniref:hypothetical protein n=1 Tax=Caulobacter sp. CCUG 60055 TaxID=2100090 RepID=UPI001FA776EC|nr:hypothetical protein [Caulobacter sp. CCUG 60055]